MLGGAVSTVGTALTYQLTSEAVDVVFSALDLTDFSNLADGAFNPNFLDVNVADLLAGFAARKLAGEIITPETEIAGVFGSIGSGVGGAIFSGTSNVVGETAVSKFVSSALSKIFTAAPNVVPVIGTAIGLFVGQVLGTALGNLFGDNDPPSSWAKVEYNDIDQEFRIEMFGGNSADTATANSMASQMLDAVNNVIALSHGTLRLGATTPTVLIGYKGDKFTVGDWYGDIREFDTAADAVMHGAFKMMKGFDLVGGHAVLMRAWHNSDATNIHEFQEDLEVAEAFQNYLLDPTSILALMMNEPDSDLAQAWAAILQRAAELELHLPSDKDLDGGWGSILLAQGVDPSLIPDIQDDTIILTDPVTGEETVLHHAIGPGYEIVRIEGTDGNDIIEVIVDGPSHYLCGCRCR